MFLLLLSLINWELLILFLISFKFFLVNVTWLYVFFWAMTKSISFMNDMFWFRVVACFFCVFQTQACSSLTAFNDLLISLINPATVGGLDNFFFHVSKANSNFAYTLSWAKGCVLGIRKRLYQSSHLCAQGKVASQWKKAVLTNHRAASWKTLMSSSLYIEYLLH